MRSRQQLAFRDDAQVGRPDTEVPGQCGHGPPRRLRTAAANHSRSAARVGDGVCKPGVHVGHAIDRRNVSGNRPRCPHGAEGEGGADGEPGNRTDRSRHHHVAHVDRGGAASQPGDRPRKRHRHAAGAYSREDCLQADGHEEKARQAGVAALGHGGHDRRPRRGASRQDERHATPRVRNDESGSKADPHR
jgi:hypothetical protein